MNKTEIFRELHRRTAPLVLPNAWDFGSAAMLADEFPAIGTTSLGVAMAAGLADGAGLTREETLSLATRLARLSVPVTVDIEGGFSEDPSAVADFVEQLAELGIAGVNVEDGRSNAALAEPTHQAELISAIKSRAPDLFVNARVDTYWLSLALGDDGHRYRAADAGPHSTLDRARRYADAGADGIFVPGVTAPEEIGRIVAAVPLPVNTLYSATGPSITELTDLGVRRISTGSLLYRAALAAAVEAAWAARDGSEIRPGIPGYREVQAITEPG